METAQKFDRVTYISATPIEREYWLQEIAHLPEYRIEWPDAKQINISSHKDSKPLDYMASLCKRRAKESHDCNYHIFLNSVKGISSIISKAKLNKEDVRIVCSRNNSSYMKNKAKLPQGYDIEDSTTDPKKFNFYTSTCFEGQDIYDENGRTFIVSEPHKQHTMMDISTSFIQICGRIRNSKYNGEIIHIYATSYYKEYPTLKEFIKYTRMEIQKAEKQVK